MLGSKHAAFLNLGLARPNFLLTDPAFAPLGGQTYSQHGGYTCPLCNASVCDMRAAWLYLDEEIANTPMPTEYANSRVGMLCNDCHEQGEVGFHALGLKCTGCGSYNTRRR